MSNDPRYGVARVLRPYAGFQDNYQGKIATTPIMMTEDGIALDSRALSGDAGIDPNLIRGLPVSFGQDITLYIPLMSPLPIEVDYLYQWAIIWRCRNLSDYLKDKKTPYQISKSSFGLEKVALPDPGPRFILPTAQEIITEEENPGTVLGGGSYKLRVATYTAPARVDGIDDLPINPSGQKGYAQQGVLVQSKNFISFAPIRLKAKGNELIVGVYRSSAGVTNWDFTGPFGTDFQLFEYFGPNSTTGKINENIGVYVFTGSE